MSYVYNSWSNSSPEELGIALSRSQAQLPYSKDELLLVGNAVQGR